MTGRDTLVATIRLQAAAIGSGTVAACPFYEALTAEMADDAERGGPTATLFEPFAGAPFEGAHLLRVLGGIHRLVLAGRAPELARHFPSTGGDGDAHAAMAAVRPVLADPPPELLDALTRPPQTNEVGRSAALASGLLVVAAETDLPLRLREIGASAGLNLRPDAYWYEQDGRGWGDPASPVRFVDLWQDGAPPFEPGAHIVDRRGCDRSPVDPRTDDGALTLLSYVWPQPEERFALARAAIEIARREPATVDRADAPEWLATQLRDPRPGTALVVSHSVVWQYLDGATRAAIISELRRAGEAATPDSPVAWVRLEPRPETYVPAELRLTLWDGTADEPADRLLATTGFHGGPLDWLE